MQRTNSGGSSVDKKPTNGLWTDINFKGGKFPFCKTTGTLAGKLKTRSFRRVRQGLRPNFLNPNTTMGAESNTKFYKTNFFSLPLPTLDPRPSRRLDRGMNKFLLVPFAFFLFGSALSAETDHPDKSTGHHDLFGW